MPPRSDEGTAPERPDGGTAPEPSKAGAGREPEDDDGGPLRALSFAVLLALAVEIGLLALLGRAAA